MRNSPTSRIPFDRKATLAFAVILVLLRCTVATAHPAHETNAELVWNATSKSLEVALKLRGIDLEAALTTKGSKRVDLESTEGVDAQIEQYLNRCFKIQAPDGSFAPLQFAGKDVTAREVWLYFQFPLTTDSPFGHAITNRVLFGSLENQKNKVAFRAGRIGYSLEFTQQHPTRKLAETQPPASATWQPPARLELLPQIPELPDLFTMADGTRVSTVEQWKQRRQEIAQIIQYFEYGHLPPRPDQVVAKRLTRQDAKSHPNAIRESIQLSIGSQHQLPLDVAIHLPKSDKPCPVIVMPVYRITELPCLPMLLDAGFALVQFERDDLAPDQSDKRGPAQAAYPNSDWGTLAVWAWGAMRVVDYLESRPAIDMNRIIVTGHSRDGKAALLAGALDERFAIVAPNGSGCGGAGCFRNTPPTAETLAKITDPERFGYWFHPRLRWFKDQEARLPLDQHFVKALVAPRALLCTEARDDLWANPLGTRRTSLAARDVYSFLSAENKLGLSYRDGQHDQTLKDWQTLLSFAQWHFFGEAPDDVGEFWQTP